MLEGQIKEYDSLVDRYRRLVESKSNKQDFIEYNEILFSAHSCGIEGNSFTVDETRALKEKGLGMIPYGKSLLESFEILDHFKAYEYLLSNLDKQLSENLLKETHRLLTEHTLSYRTSHDDHPAIPGEYTMMDMCAGDTIFGDHEALIKQVPKLMDATQRMLEAKVVHPMILAARFHGFYEYLHPFRDGNGRLGRLFSNFILLKNDLPLVIIEKRYREEYINALKLIRKEGTDEYLVDFFFKQSIERMRNEIESKESLTNDLTKGFDFYDELTKRDHEFQVAVTDNDFVRLTSLNSQGYTPSPGTLKSLEGSVSAKAMIAIREIFALPGDTPGVSGIRLAHNDGDGPRVELDKGLNI